MISNINLRRLRKDRGGGIEGLPLQLMIIILIATLGTAIILGWMGSLSTPNGIGTVSIDSGGIDLDQKNGTEYFTDSGYVRIFVADQNGDALDGAAVVLRGCGAATSDGKTVYGITDADGFVEFRDVHASLRGAKTGFIDVEVSKSGYGNNSTAKIMVIA
ncbi:MAG: carboxypeptidase-like regulatory domain-containing protein [Methanomassiliicoccaceae archaeon]|jgi:hypothetical protein|nr:carboxypeptidase-like regulatory domain-containing protein [Methanomassiliicoccaceae archaeon]